MSLKKTVRYIMEYVRTNQVSLGALGFYTYLLSLEKNQRQIPRDALKYEAGIVENSLYKYVRELTAIGVLEVEQTPGKSSTYTPFILTEEQLREPQKMRGLKKNCAPSLSKMDSTVVSKREEPGVRPLKKCGGYTAEAMRLLGVVNTVLPKGSRWQGVVPVKKQKDLVDLSAQVNIAEYAAWYVREKLADKGFNWGLFLYPAMVQEYEARADFEVKQKDSLKTTSKWAGKSAEIRKAAEDKAAKIKKLRSEK